MSKKYKILEKSASAVLLYDEKHDMYKVQDIENYCIAMGCYANCKLAFDEYDINEVRKQRKDMFEQWLKENAQA